VDLVGVLTQRRPCYMMDLERKRGEHSEEKPRTDSATAQGWWKNTGVLGLGFIPTRTKRRAQTRETKQAIDLVLVNHKDPGDAD
jgi:hypothetical protein